LLIMPQALAALGTKFFLPAILGVVGYRIVLISNTIILGLVLMLFALVDHGTAPWLIVLLAAVYGAFQSLQLTSMNTLVYSDVSSAQTSNASTIASTLQQLSLSFGVAAAGLTTAYFIPESVRSNPTRFMNGVHEAFLALGAFTVVSTVVFWRLKPGDGGAVSHERDVAVGA
jgi:MFS family permease